ncbi:ribosomal protein S5 domain 2-type protein [Mycena amicta]|nr:ribosomal protein S5 domain 2-type protein [Mycena amicta]
MDRRRINGPTEESFAPVFEADPERWTVADGRKERGPLDIRAIFLQPGLITQANGSAYIETQKTKIACAVYGPRQSKNASYSDLGRLNVEVKFTPFSCTRRRAPLRDAEDRSLAVAIHQALISSVRLELLPKSTIDIFITIIECDGLQSCVAAGSIAASTALADAGIELFGLVVSCAASLVENQVWLDPTEEEERASSGTLILSCLPALNKITNVWHTGQMSAADALRCMQACQQKNAEIHSVVAQALLENAKI